MEVDTHNDLHEANAASAMCDIVLKWSAGVSSTHCIAHHMCPHAVYVPDYCMQCCTRNTNKGQETIIMQTNSLIIIRMPCKPQDSMHADSSHSPIILVITSTTIKDTTASGFQVGWW